MRVSQIGQGQGLNVQWHDQEQNHVEWMHGRRDPMNFVEDA